MFAFPNFVKVWHCLEDFWHVLQELGHFFLQILANFEKMQLNKSADPFGVSESIINQESRLQIPGYQPGILRRPLRRVRVHY